MDYAKNSLITEKDFMVDARMGTGSQQTQETPAPSKNYDCVIGYKKIKIHESRSHSVNSNKQGKVLTQTVAVKDQSPLSKAYRLLNHYFDYDKWVQEKNLQPAPKAKPDPSKKKAKKKTLDW